MIRNLLIAAALTAVLAAPAWSHEPKDLPVVPHDVTLDGDSLECPAGWALLFRTPLFISDKAASGKTFHFLQMGPVCAHELRKPEKWK